MTRYNVEHEDKLACFDTVQNEFITAFMSRDSYKKWIELQKHMGFSDKLKTILLSTCLGRMRKVYKRSRYVKELNRLGLRQQGQRGLGKKPSKRGVVLQISIRAEKTHLAPKIKEFAKEICSDKEEKPQKTAFSYFNFIKKKTCI